MGLMPCSMMAVYKALLHTSSQVALSKPSSLTFSRILAQRGELRHRQSERNYSSCIMIRHAMMRFCKVTPLIFKGRKSLGRGEPSG